MITSFDEVFDMPKYLLNTQGFVVSVLCGKTGRAALAVILCRFLGKLKWHCGPSLARMKVWDR